MFEDPPEIAPDIPLVSVDRCCSRSVYDVLHTHEFLFFSFHFFPHNIILSSEAQLMFASTDMPATINAFWPSRHLSRALTGLTMPLNLRVRHGGML